MFQSFVKGFGQYAIDYLFINKDITEQIANIISANRKDSGKVQFDQWSQAYSNVYESKLKRPVENKEIFMNVECPLIIQAAIGGDLDIFKFLVDRGANLNAIGHICLSRKNKNF